MKALDGRIAAGEHPELRGIDLALLRYLLHRAVDGHITTTAGDLSRVLRYSEKPIRLALRRLQRERLIEPAGRAWSGSVWRLVVDYNGRNDRSIAHVNAPGRAA